MVLEAKVQDQGVSRILCVEASLLGLQVAVSSLGLLMSFPLCLSEPQSPLFLKALVTLDQ